MAMMQHTARIVVVASRTTTSSSRQTPLWVAPWFRIIAVPPNPTSKDWLVFRRWASRTTTSPAQLVPLVQPKPSNRSSARSIPITAETSPPAARSRRRDQAASLSATYNKNTGNNHKPARPSFGGPSQKQQILSSDRRSPWFLRKKEEHWRRDLRLSQNEDNGTNTTTNMKQLHALRELLLRSRPFGRHQFETAVQILNDWKKVDAELLSPVCANVAVALLERLVHELGRTATTDNPGSGGLQGQFLFLVDPRFYNPVLNQWKETAKHWAARKSATKNVVISPQEVWQILQQLAQQYKFFQYDIMTLTNLLNVVIALEARDPARAPHVAETFFRDVIEPHAVPNTITYATLLKVWADSGLPEASRRMDQLMERALACTSTTNSATNTGNTTDESESQQPVNEALYHIWFRYWADRGEMDKLQACLDRLQQQCSSDDGSTSVASPLTMVSWTQVVYGYCRLRDLEKAAHALKHNIIEGGLFDPQKESDVRLLAECLQHILLSCRRAWDSKSLADATKEKLLHTTQGVVDAYARPDWLGVESLERVKGSMLDVYARTGRLDRVEALFAQLDHLDTVKYSILIGAYTRNHRPEKATEVLLKVLEQRNESFDYASLLVGVLDAWAESSHADGYVQAEAVFRLVDSEPCRSMGVRHGVASYGAMLKCLVRLHKYEDSGERAEALLNEMEQANLAPNEICYNLAVRACYNAGDMERAEKLMTSFQNSDTPPTTRTFSDILMHFAAMGTPKAAERCESILAHMQSMSRQRPEVTPDEVSYNCVMTAWAKANVPESPQSMARIFESMMSEGIEPDFVSCNQLLSALCKSDRKEDILQADKVLMRLEKTSQNPEIPNSLNYMEVMNGYVKIKDPERATRLLVRRIEAYLRGKKEVAFRLPQALDRVIKLWVDVAKDLHQATSVLMKVQELHESGKLPIGPDRRSFHPLLERWRKSSSADKRHYIEYLDAKIKQLYNE